MFLKMTQVVKGSSWIATHFLRFLCSPLKQGSAVIINLHCGAPLLRHVQLILVLVLRVEVRACCCGGGGGVGLELSLS